MQEQFGRAYRENEIMVFQAQILQFETVVSCLIVITLYLLYLLQYLDVATPTM
jgi:hypothetical protein